MASNDYYHVNKPPAAASPPPAPYYPGSAYNNIPSTSSTPAPPYSQISQAPGASHPPPRGNTVSPFESVFDDHVYPVDSTQDGFRHNANQTPQNTNNPNVQRMNTVHTVSSVYSSDNPNDPRNMQPLPPLPQQHNAYGQQPDPYGQQSNPYNQQSNPYNQDTAYYGQSSASPDSSRPHVADNIPLQSRQEHKPNDIEMNENDHVYDAPQGSRRSKSRRDKKKVGFGQLGMFGADRKGIPWVVYIFTLVQVAVFIAEIVKNAQLTGSPIMTKPSFNPMIGPSTYVMINMGARYVACMHNVKGIQDLGETITWPCPNSTSSDANNPSNQCGLGDLCGFGGVPEPTYHDINQKPEPDQWFRFITPIFLHAGLIHIGFNLLLQMTIGKEMEIAIGSIRFFLVYVSAGIFGNVMGANYAGVMTASTGASGALFGVIALTLLDLLYSWKDRRSPVKDLMFIMLDIIISFILGLLPGLDNFAHIGGFLMGLALGICVLHSPNSLRRRLGTDPSYASMQLNPNQGPPPFLKNPVGFFKGRKPLWWAWWLVRGAFLLTVIIVFIVLLNNFYVYHNTCSWCKYLSCIPVNNWCELDNFKITRGSSS
ncbi:rhomboid family membrane protein [Colletotrichum truncatum]|uniref:Rhomboid family membrane protein n=1 Tax=Colletotrichum truncatum TaxID=5467 RepID=A0ACC3ZJ40_COLTU|nr:rhomboid family membrane protein [Colletotrichum truncatum]KAF6791940.1 rhomboid family membrane protein [Colletotrichum truncatum]